MKISFFAFFLKSASEKVKYEQAYRNVFFSLLFKKDIKKVKKNDAFWFLENSFFL